VFGSSGFAMEGTLFHSDAEDFIERGTDGTTQNIEEYRFHGVELTASYDGVEDLGLAASYTYLESENLSSSADIETLQNRPEHKFSLRVDYSVTTTFRVGGNYLYVADSYSLSRTSPTTADDLGDYGVLDLDASMEFLDRRVRAYARIHNAFDEDYSESFGFPQPGRSYVVGAELRL
jgi:outer membrane cobalamin receptor